jgi:RNA polymerase sigma-70 factor (ECF subfamily)
VTLALVAPPPARSDVELIAACIAGNEGAQRALFRREYPRVHATVYRLLGGLRDVDDLVQETFIAAFRALSSYRGEARLSTWIDRIAVRIVFRHIRARRPTTSLESIAEPGDDGDLDAQTHAREGLRRLYVVLEQMTPEARTAFALYAIDGRSIAEVATLTGTTAVVSKVRIWRARREVRRRAEADPALAELMSNQRAEVP